MAQACLEEKYFRNLSTGARPLELQNEILSNIGYETERECMSVGDATHLTHLFCFYIGKVTLLIRSQCVLEYHIHILGAVLLA